MATLIIADRDRTVNYNGLETSITQYQCSGCKNTFIMDHPRASFCPRCGEAFVDVDDVSA